MSGADDKYMLIALRLAKRGISMVEPNPLVGCVIVKNDKIVGRGWHKKFGGPHAEINALENCKSTGENPKAGTMYVTLEPCCHQGKTGPCTQTIIEAGIVRVVVAMADPSEHADGKGIEQLRNAGIDVKVGVFGEEAVVLNAPFIKFARTGKCWVILKWAQSIDGKMAWADSSAQRWISNDKSRKDAHKLRRRVGGILVGIETLLADDPLLTPRPSRGRKPTRIVLDSHLRIQLDCKLLATAKKTPVLIVACNEAIEAKPHVVERIVGKGAEVLAVPSEQGRCDLKFLLNELSGRGIQQLLVEGGAAVIGSFVKHNLADEICVYLVPKILGKEGKVNIAESMQDLSQVVGLHNIKVKRFGDDIRLTGLLTQVAQL